MASLRMFFSSMSWTVILCCIACSKTGHCSKAKKTFIYSIFFFFVPLFLFYSCWIVFEKKDLHILQVTILPCVIFGQPFTHATSNHTILYTDIPISMMKSFCRYPKIVPLFHNPLMFVLIYPRRRVKTVSTCWLDILLRHWWL